MALGFLLPRVAFSELSPPNPPAIHAFMQKLASTMEHHKGTARLEKKDQDSLTRALHSVSITIKSFGDSAFDEPLGSCFEAGKTWIRWAEFRLTSVEPSPNSLEPIFMKWRNACDSAANSFEVTPKTSN